jgi:hypothetical protein
LGQLTLPALALAALASTKAEWGWRQGALLGISCAIKPQLAGVFVLYALFRRRWTCVSVATALGASILVIGAGWLELHDSSWRSDFRSNLNAMQSAEGSVSESNPLRHDMVNLAAPIYAVLRDDRLARMIAVGATAFVFLAAFGKFDRRRPDNDPLSLALVSVLMLLPLYHRIYDATALLFVGAWAWTNRGRLTARVALVLLAVFLVPGAAMLKTKFPDGGPEGWWYREFASIHSAWAVAGIALAMTIAMAARKARRVSEG